MSMEFLGRANLIQVTYIKKVTFQIYPLTSMESEPAEWSNCINAIDEVNRRLNSKKNKNSDKETSNSTCTLATTSTSYQDRRQMHIT